MSWGDPEIAAWIGRYPDLEGPARAVLEAGAAVRAAVAGAFVDPAEPDPPERVAAAARALREAAERFGEEPTPAAAARLVAAAALARAEAVWLAPTRRTSGAVARWAVMESARLFRTAWERLEREAAAVGAGPPPHRLLLASHVDPAVPWAAAVVAGNGVPGLPASQLPWGERCSFGGTWFQVDRADGPRRWRSADRLGFVIAAPWRETLRRVREAVDRLAATDPAAARGVEAAIPELGDVLVPARHSETFSRLGVGTFPNLAVVLHDALLAAVHRPVFGVFGGDGALRWWSGREVRDRVLALAAALERAGVGPGTAVGVAVGGDRALAYVADFALVILGAVSVGLDPGAPAETWGEVLEIAGAVAAVGDGPGLERLADWSGRRLGAWGETPPGCEPLETVPPAPGWKAPTGIGAGTPSVGSGPEGWERARRLGIEPDPEDALYTVVFTSGSTGRPKGVPVRRVAWHRRLLRPVNLWPLVVASYQPYALMADRATVWQAVRNGGRVGFCRGGAALWGDLAAVAPTYLDGPPALWRALVAPYRIAADRGAGPAELARAALEVRRRTGGRLAAAAVGGAAVEPGLAAAIAGALDVPVREGYGTTETGSIAEDGRPLPGVQVRLIDRPDLGMTAADRPHPRGELAVRTPEVASGYVGADPEAAGRFTEDGFFRTGDLAELLPDGRFRLLGRAGDLVKLSNGRFVFPPAVEAAVMASPLVRHAVALPAPDGSGVVAVVVPEDGADDPETVRRDVLRRVRAAGLPAGWMPRAVVVDRAGTRWTPEDGSLTPSLKPRRRALAARYAEAVAAACRAGCPAEGPGAAPHGIRGLVASGLGIAPQALDTARTLEELGAGSLLVAEVAAAVAAASGRAVAPAEVAARPVAELEAMAAAGRGAPAPSSAPPLHPAGVAVEELVAVDLVQLPLPARVPEPVTGGDVLVTGATGFLGVHLVAALAEVLPADARVAALVRAPDLDAAALRLREAASAAGLELPQARVVTVAGDLERARLGLDPGVWERLAGEVGVVVHAGAAVRHDLPYRAVREANVGGTRAALELAVTGRTKGFLLVSTLDVGLLAARAGAGSEGEAPLPERLPPEVLRAASGYAATKWVAERMAELVWRHAGGRLRLVTVRPGLLSWSAATGHANRHDWLTRVLLTCLELRAIPVDEPAGVPAAPVLTETSARGIEPVPVDFAAGVLARLAAGLREGSAPQAAPARLNLVNTSPGELGLVPWPRLLWLLAAAAALEEAEAPPLRPLAWRDWRELAVAEATPFAPLAAAFRELPVFPRFPAPTLRRLLGEASPPQVDLELVRRFVRRAAAS